MGTETATIDDVSGSFEVVIGRSGVGELLSFPQVTGAMSQTALFPLLSFLLFPRLPDGEADPGATWVDTATASGDAGDMTTTATLVSTYTLVGDTLVDGRALVHIAVAREVTIDNEIEEVGDVGDTGNCGLGERLRSLGSRTRARGLRRVRPGP